MQIEMYKPEVLNLNEFIKHYNLDMILNNEIIKKLYFELYNYEEILKSDIEIITADAKEELKNPEAKYNYLLEELKDYGYEPEDYSTLSDAINEYCQDHIYEHNEVYQYFIISEYDLNYWSKYTDYPIFYDEETDVYLLGITHYGMSWSFFFTTAERPQYMRIEEYDKILNKAAGTSSS